MVTSRSLRMTQSWGAVLAVTRMLGGCKVTWIGWVSGQMQYGRCSMTVDKCEVIHFDGKQQESRLLFE